MKTLTQLKVQSSIGAVYLVASERGLTGAYLDVQKVPFGKTSLLEGAAVQLQEYFAGKRSTFDLPYDVSGTDFQKKVWRALSQIPFGKTVSYSDIARKIGKPKAVRAVGSANGKNPLCILVPCHRVIAADGSLGGYSGGLGTKRKLLALEGVRL